MLKIALGLKNPLVVAGGSLPELTNPAVATNILAPKEAIDGNGTKMTGTMPSKVAADVTVSGANVTVPVGYYGTQVVKPVATATQATPTISVSATGLITATATQTAGYVVAGSKSGTQQMTVQGAQTITPTTTNQTIAANRYLTGVQTIAGDADLIAENIKAGVDIFGVAGTFTADADATAEDIMLGKVAYVNGVRIVGTYEPA